MPRAIVVSRCETWGRSEDRELRLYRLTAARRVVAACVEQIAPTVPLAVNHNGTTTAFVDILS